MALGLPPYIFNIILYIFIIQNFRTIVLIFIVIFTTFRPICSPASFRIPNRCNPFDVLLWTPSHGQANAGRPARNYILQLCGDKGCSPEDLPEAINDREGWRERVRNIRADGMTTGQYSQVAQLSGGISFVSSHR